MLERKGITGVRAAYVKTAKNAPVERLFEKLGFTVVNGSIQEIGDRKDYTATIESLPMITDVFVEVTEDWA